MYGDKIYTAFMYKTSNKIKNNFLLSRIKFMPQFYNDFLRSLWHIFDESLSIYINGTDSVTF